MIISIGKKDLKVKNRKNQKNKKKEEKKGKKMIEKKTI